MSPPAHDQSGDRLTGFRGPPGYASAAFTCAIWRLHNLAWGAKARSD
jgi:hypothetical protein